MKSKQKSKYSSDSFNKCIMQRKESSRVYQRSLATALVASSSTTYSYYTLCENNVNGSRRKAPPRFGKSIPRHLLFQNDFMSSRYGKSLQKRVFTTTVKGSASESDLLDLSESKKDRGDCPLCKKYSQGPCGEFFQKWIQCIDSLDSGSKNNEKCDSLLVPLDNCLKKHKDFYDKINVYDSESDVDADNISKWIEFIAEIEDTKESTKEESGVKIEWKELPHDEIEMQIRPQRQMGAAMFPERESGKEDDRILLLAYVKDQDGNLIGAGSVEELYPFQKQFVLRFDVNRSCEEITAYALYGYESDSNKSTAPTKMTIYSKTLKVPQ